MAFEQQAIQEPRRSIPAGFVISVAEYVGISVPLMQLETELSRVPLLRAEAKTANATGLRR